MADITGNFGINPHGLSSDKINGKKNNISERPETEKNNKLNEINLDKDPHAISGKSLVKTTSARRADGYSFDPKKVEADVLEFQAYYAVKEAMDDYKKGLIAKGYTEADASEKAKLFAELVLGA